jgi:hypothetical protein
MLAARVYHSNALICSQGERAKFIVSVHFSKANEGVTIPNFGISGSRVPFSVATFRVLFTESLKPNPFGIKAYSYF